MEVGGASKYHGRLWSLTRAADQLSGQNGLMAIRLDVESGDRVHHETLEVEAYSSVFTVCGTCGALPKLVLFALQIILGFVHQQPSIGDYFM